MHLRFRLLAQRWADMQRLRRHLHTERRRLLGIAKRLDTGRRLRWPLRRAFRGSVVMLPLRLYRRSLVTRAAMPPVTRRVTRLPGTAVSMQVR